MQTWLRRLAVSILAGIVLGGQLGCGRVANRAVAETDIAVQVELQRSWFAGYGPFQSEPRSRPAERRSSKTHGSSSGDCGGPINLSGLEGCSGEALAGVVIFIVVVIAAAAAIHTASYIPPTHVEIQPDCRPDYCQRLYWGDNTVWFPVDIVDADTPVRIKVTGDRDVDRVLVVDLTIERSVVLK